MTSQGRSRSGTSSCPSRWPTLLVASAAAALLLVAGHAGDARADSTLVTAPDGTFQGKPDATGKVNEFLGVRYAQPPVGSFRWAPPQPVTPAVGVQDATNFANHCPQAFTPFGNPSLTEDCLFLNVYTPADHVDGEDEGDGRHPVMVWIHGGALLLGESDDYDATKLAKAGVVVVTINYRLGALGFLAHPALTGESPDHISGNYGIEDQQAALRWVKRNIRAFGGNPERVTIFGESAGGLSTYTNLISPTAADLFHGAIVESGSYQQVFPTLAQLSGAGVNFANVVGCTQSTPAAVLACLRALPVTTILANSAASNIGPNPSPNIDGKVITESVGAALLDGHFNRVPIIAGTNHDEWRLFVALDFDLTGHPVTSAGYLAAIGATIGTTNAGLEGLIAAQYPLVNFPSPDLAVSALGTDAIFACAAHFDEAATSRFVPTFVYEFNDENAPQDFLPPVTFPYGAAHASEIQYLFPVPSPNTSGLHLAHVPLTAAQQALSDQMVTYWTEFAKKGNPNSDDTPRWARFDIDQDNMQSLVPPTPTTENNFTTFHKCTFWDGLSGRVVPTE